MKIEEVSVLVFTAFFALASTASPAHAVQVVSPKADASAEGNNENAFPFNLSNIGLASQRYQQVYNASEFSAISSPMLITQISFRPDITTGASFSSTLTSIQIDMSTTSVAADGMSTTFASNLGANDTVVFARGPLSLSSAFTGPANGPKDFDIVINLTTPFLYNPSAGNLLLDVRNFGGGATTGFDAELLAGDGSSRAFTGGGSSTVADPSGVVETRALVTRFTVTSVPEASSGILLMVGSFVVAGFRRREGSRFGG